MNCLTLTSFFKELGTLTLPAKSVCVDIGRLGVVFAHVIANLIDVLSLSVLRIIGSVGWGGTPAARDRNGVVKVNNGKSHIP
eukprot:1545604-Amphidinium_carterae.1